MCWIEQGVGHMNEEEKERKEVDKKVNDAIKKYLWEYCKVEMLVGVIVFILAFIMMLKQFGMF